MLIFGTAMSALAIVADDGTEDFLPTEPLHDGGEDVPEYPVPTPGTLFLFGSGLLGLYGVLRSRLFES